MAQNYQKIGDYISVVDNRNTDGSITNLMGISIDKCYIPSVANVIGTDLHNYKVIRKGQFACSLMQVSRDQRIPLAMYTSDEPAIMSPAYVMFEVSRPDELLPEYLELWFKRFFLITKKGGHKTAFSIQIHKITWLKPVKPEQQQQR